MNILKKTKNKILDQSSQLAAEKRKIESEKSQLLSERTDFERYATEARADIELKRKEIAIRSTELDELKESCDSQLDLIGDFIHEQKRINERIQKAITFTQTILKRNSYHLDKETTELILNNWKTIEALTEISNQRMELFEFSLAPELFNSMDSELIYPYKIFEKIYKSINSGFDQEARTFHLINNSYGAFRTKRILSVALFILLDNAWKYTIPEEPINIHFNEDVRAKRLTVKITNWGPWLEDEEIQHLTDRGFRGHNAKTTHRDLGKGLGLAIAKRIFEICGVSAQFLNESSTPLEKDGKKYGKFCVELVFYPMESRAIPSR